MKVFISYSHNDKEYADQICKVLKGEGYDIWIDKLRIKNNDNIAKLIDKGIDQADVVLLLISQSSLSSTWVQREFSAISLHQIGDTKKYVIPIKLDNSNVPSYLSNIQYLDMSFDINQGIDLLKSILLKITKNELHETKVSNIENDYIDTYTSILKERLSKGRLTLFCGAGVSVGAGIPAWNDLLLNLLESMMTQISEKTLLDVGWKSAKEFWERNQASSLILGKYIKNYLGKEFSRKVRDVLYQSQPTTCPLIESIIGLARPQRDNKPLDSIITFNFDCLIEESLNKEKIKNKAIYAEGNVHDPSELPIYHVHGYLPRKGILTEQNELVFSEDAYHSQFIDSFSWSNLIQLNKLTQNTCLFIGISLTDPNMRRLLDVAWRKNPYKELKHYIIKKVPKTNNGIDAIDKVTKLLEEQDANALGLNVILISEYDQIPSILAKVSDWNLKIASTC